ncbi:MAG: DUF456 domain-containing protein [Phycisphaerales bacterium]
MHFVAAGILLITGLIGVALTVVALPGIWVVVGVALLCQLWQPGLFSWWTIGVALGLGLLAELIEFLASVAGSTKAGGTRHGAIWSIVGGIAGAILGSPVVPIIGTIVGGVIGAGVGAMVGEMMGSKMPWRSAARVGQGAATGRLVSIVVKSGVCAVIVGMLVVGAIIQ